MRRLFPTYAEEVDLAEAYAYPEGRRWVRANMVSSVDGSAVAEGRSGGLSGMGDKEVFAALRGLCDVVLVGAGTARAEGYRAPKPKEAYADLRVAAGQRPAPSLALVTSRLDLDPASPLFGGPEPTFVITSRSSDEAVRERLAEVAEVIVAGEEHVDVATALDRLCDRGLSRVLCEGGPRLLGEVVASGSLDELCLTVSPALVGGDGPRVLDGPALDGVRDIDLAHLLEQDGSLFARYVLTRH